MKICISGLSCSGKTGIGIKLEKDLKINHVHNSYKRHVNSKSELLALLKKSDPIFTKDFDKDIIQRSKKGDCVVTTWLGPWMIKDATLKVWLYASEKERAKRYSKQNKTSYAKSLKYIRDKDRLTAISFKKVYGIDINDKSIFDIQINTEKMKIDEQASIIAMVALFRTKKSFR